MIIIDDDGVIHKVLPMDTLDKLRAEIETYQSDAFYSKDVLMNKRTVLEIIDKYRNEVSS